MKEPISTITNLFYGIVGVMFIGELPLVGLALISLFVSSAWFHWTKGIKANTADVMGMFFVFNSIIGAIMVNLGASLFASHAFVVGMTAFMVWKRDSYSTIETIAIQFAMIILGMSVITNDLWFIGWFGLAMIFNIPFLFHQTFNKITGIALNENLVDVSHGIWHVSTAMGFHELITNLTS